MTARSRRTALSPAPCAGFSLLELMVALTVGVLVIAIAYGLAGASTRQFQSDQRVAVVQAAARMALDQLQRDIERAGYLAPSNSMPTKMRSCEASPIRLQAIEFHNGTYNDLLGAAAERNQVDLDELTLVGSYATSDQFLVAGFDGASGLADGRVVLLQSSWHAVRRNFLDRTDPSERTLEQAALDDVFLPGRVLALRSTTGDTFLRRIVGAAIRTGETGDPRVAVRVDAPFPVGSPCLGGLGGGATVSVLSRIRYVATRMGEGSLANTGARDANAESDASGATGLALVRREIGFDSEDAPVLRNADGAPLERVVLEHLVEIDFRFTFETTGAASRMEEPIDGVLAEPRLAWVGSDEGAAQPERARSVLLSLSARTAERDPRFLSGAARNRAADPLSRFDFADGESRPAARVRTARTEVALVNVR